MLPYKNMFLANPATHIISYESTWDCHKNLKIILLFNHPNTTIGKAENTSKKEDKIISQFTPRFEHFNI